MSSRHFLVLVNPHGGAKQGPAITELVRPVFTNAGIGLDIRRTECAGHATEIVRTIDLSVYDAICVVGGDGTTHEVVAGLMRRTDHALLPLGLISAGTGNTLHHHLGCGNPLEAAQRIVSGCAHPLDVIRVSMGQEVEYCVNIVGWGAAVDINVRAERLRMLGKSRYAMAAITQLLFPKARTATIKLDNDTIDGDFLFILTCNTATTGTGMRIAPQASIDDGKLDVVLMRDTSRWQALQVFRKVFDGSHLSLACIEHRQVRSLQITPRRPDPLNLDGELKGTAPFVADVLSGALQILY